MSGSGKTFLTEKIVKKYRHKFTRIISIGSTLACGKELNIERDDDFNPFTEEVPSTSTLIIFDDIIFEKKKIELAGQIYIKGRHLNISAIFLTQNIFLPDKNFRLITLNSTHVFLLRTRDVQQIRCFTQTFLDKSKRESFVELYKRRVLKIEYGYLLIDFTRHIEHILSIRTNIFNETYEMCFSL